HVVVAAHSQFSGLRVEPSHSRRTQRLSVRCTVGSSDVIGGRFAVACHAGIVPTRYRRPRREVGTRETTATMPPQNPGRATGPRCATGSGGHLWGGRRRRNVTTLERP